MDTTQNFSYYNYIMGDSKNAIQHVFHEKWISFLDNIELPYAQAIQLRIGSHLRPLLVYWGSALGANTVNTIYHEETLELAICVELMHKISIIVDDLIDKDIKRHSRITFHKQFSSEETIIFAVYMLGKAFDTFYSVSAKFPILHKELFNLYSKTLQLMADGCLQELSLTPRECYSCQKITDIIHKETSTLIKNSLLIGFLINEPSDPEIQELVEDIGDKVGYLFQVMNDMEPFCFDKNLTLHKGTKNMDFERSRKNIVLPYIYDACTSTEKEKLLQAYGDKGLTDLVSDLYQKYQLDKILNDNLVKTEKQIERLFDNLMGRSINQQCLNDFYSFYKNILKIGRQRLKSVNQEPID